MKSCAGSYRAHAEFAPTWNRQQLVERQTSGTRNRQWLHDHGDADRSPRGTIVRASHGHAAERTTVDGEAFRSPLGNASRDVHRVPGTCARAPQGHLALPWARARRFGSEYSIDGAGRASRDYLHIRACFVLRHLVATELCRRKRARDGSPRHTAPQNLSNRRSPIRGRAARHLLRNREPEPTRRPQRRRRGNRTSDRALHPHERQKELNRQVSSGRGESQGARECSLRRTHHPRRVGRRSRAVQVPPRAQFHTRVRLGPARLPEPAPRQ